MARAAVTSDVFNAIAEAKRREIVELLALGSRGVTELVEAIRLPQPAVSKHLGVLRAVGLVAVEKRGRERVYSLDAEHLRTVHDWSGMFERFWDNQAGRIRERAERKARETKHRAR